MPSILSNKTAVESAINNSKNLREVLSNLGLRAAGGNYAALKRWCVTHELTLPENDYSKHNQSSYSHPKYTDDDIFVEDSTYSNRTSIKKRLRTHREFYCDSCGLDEVWNGKPIVLQLEHINGIHNDNRFENLSLLCPNCHSQTSTFAGRNSKK